MSCSQEFVQAQLEERRRTVQQLHLLHSASSSARQEEIRAPNASHLASTYHWASRTIRRCLAWLSASQLGPLSDNTTSMDITSHRH